MNDIRRINPPSGGTQPIIYDPSSLINTLFLDPTSPEQKPEKNLQQKQQHPLASGWPGRRTRAAKEVRKIFIATGLIPSATGSAFLELQAVASQEHTRKSRCRPTAGPPQNSTEALEPMELPDKGAIKISAAAHLGPLPSSRTVGFAPNAVLSVTVKLASFATRTRRGYLRDTLEKDLGARVESALRAAIIPNRWPKFGCDVSLTVLEADADLGADGSIYLPPDMLSLRPPPSQSADDPLALTAKNPSSRTLLPSLTRSLCQMTLLAACINVASAAVLSTGIDCIDVLSAGVAATVAVPEPRSTGKKPSGRTTCDRRALRQEQILDPDWAEHISDQPPLAACVAAYLPSRDQLANLWVKYPDFCSEPNPDLGWEDERLGKGEAEYGVGDEEEAEEEGEEEAEEAQEASALASGSASGKASDNDQPDPDQLHDSNSTQTRPANLTALIEAACAAAMGASTVIHEAVRENSFSLLA